MPALSSESSFQPLVRLLDYAHYFFAGLVLITAVLLTWQHYGMEKVINLAGADFPVFIEDDRIGGGASVGLIERRG